MPPLCVESPFETHPPRISVIVRTVTGGARLGEALDSLAAQTLRNFEVIVVDMSSGKAEPMIARAASGISRLRRLAIRRRLTRPAALNLGIRAATAPAIAILDDDNVYDREHLDVLLAGLASTRADYVYTGVRHVTFAPDGRALATRAVAIPFRFDQLLFSNFIYATGSAYRRAIWERVGGYDERFAVFEDWDFLIRVGRAGSIVHLPVVSGESRKYTGADGVAGFQREIDAVRRCHAGIHWKHRRLYDRGLRRELKAVFAGHCRRRVPARTGLLAATLLGWPLEGGWDLVAWWGRNFLAGARALAGP